jgi:hypothetical protein
LSPPLYRLFYSAPDFFPSPEKPFELPMHIEPLAIAFATQYITNPVLQTKYLDPWVLSWWTLKQLRLIDLPLILWQHLLALLILRMVLLGFAMERVWLSFYILHCPFYWSILSIIPLVSKFHCVTIMDCSLKISTSWIPDIIF